MTQIYADGFSRISFSNNNLRILLTQNGPDNTQAEVATLILPGNQAAAFVNGMANSLKQLEEQMRAQSEGQDKPAEDVQ